MSTLNWLRKTGFAEGISFLVLLLVAMPLKYFYNMPLAVKLVGWLHGILFVAFLAMAWKFRDERRKSFGWLTIAFLAALIPTGTFFFDKKLKEEQQA